MARRASCSNQTLTEETEKSEKVFSVSVVLWSSFNKVLTKVKSTGTFDIDLESFRIRSNELAEMKMHHMKIIIKTFPKSCRIQEP